MRFPHVIGHRGAAARAPENTLAGFRKAKSLGIEWVEFDVRLTRDARAILFHDDRLERTTDGKGPVAAADFAAIRQLDAGAWYGAAYRGERVPSLAEALTLLAELGLGFDLEIKPEPGRSSVLVATIAAALRATAPKTAVIVTSFDHAALAEFAGVAPEFPRGYLVGLLPQGWRAAAAALGAQAVICDHRRLTARQAREVKDSGLPLLAYTVNEPARAQRLLALGVNSIISDAPDLVLAVA